MVYICDNCGHVFDESERAVWKESRGEFWGMPCEEEMDGCPVCHSAYLEAHKCAVCGEYHTSDDLNGGVCDSCIDKYKHDVDMCYRVGAHQTESVELNCFLASIFDKEDIEKILFEELKSREKYIMEYVQAGCEKFVESDRSWFGDNLGEEVSKSEDGEG